MSRLGARTMRIRRAGVWMFQSQPEEPEVLCLPPADSRFYGEEEVRIACEWTLVFMLMFRNPKLSGWYPMTAEHAHTFPSGSYRDCFFWGLRMLGDENLDDFRAYLEWKISQFDRGILRREGPVW